MTQTYGRAPVGERAYGTVPGHWETIALTCGLRLSGVTAAMACGCHGHRDVRELCGAGAGPGIAARGDVVIWDNPKAAAVRGSGTLCTATWTISCV